MAENLEGKFEAYPKPWKLVDEGTGRDRTYTVYAANGATVLTDEAYYPEAPYSYAAPGHETAGIDTARLIVEAVNAHG